MSEEQQAAPGAASPEPARVKIVLLLDDWPGSPRGAIVSVDASRVTDLETSGAARRATPADLALAFPNFTGD